MVGIAMAGDWSLTEQHVVYAMSQIQRHEGKVYVDQSDISIYFIFDLMRKFVVLRDYVLQLVAASALCNAWAL